MSSEASPSRLKHKNDNDFSQANSRMAVLWGNRRNPGSRNSWLLSIVFHGIFQAPIMPRIGKRSMVEERMGNHHGRKQCCDYYLIIMGKRQPGTKQPNFNQYFLKFQTVSWICSIITTVQEVGACWTDWIALHCIVTAFGDLERDFFREVITIIHCITTSETIADHIYTMLDQTHMVVYIICNLCNYILHLPNKNTVQWHLCQNDKTRLKLGHTTNIQQGLELHFPIQDSIISIGVLHLDVFLGQKCGGLL